MATYIELDASNDSIFSRLKTTSANTNNDKEECVKKILDSLYLDNPIQAIKQAYFNCVVPIKKMLRSHLSMIFANDLKSFELMFEGDEGESLYDIRNKIAHGGIDALSDFERQKIDSRIWDIERTARKYFQNVIRMVMGKSPFEYRMIKCMSIPFAIGSHKGMYKGPIHMAEFYTYVKR